MPYSSVPDPYVDTETGLLKNLLGITSEKKLEDAEADITTAIIASLPDQPALGDFDLDHLKNIHWELFNAIYSWAGEIRTVEMAKGNTRFANSDAIEQAATQLFDELHTEYLLKGLPREQYVNRLAHYYSEINILHTFREGNGRTERVFFSQLVAEAGYRLAWELMNAGENLRACVAAYEGDESILARMLDDLIESSGK
ncbi:filamentation induced by cAMP protein Fic [candidate division TM7 genomosp. GTL1]|nr:filamentation induced by cAMP protein Fic [candidate division TM7 genomosp. GTL1]